MQLTVGDIVEGKITAVKDYGVFVDIGNGKFGMVHISEIAQSYVSEIRDFVKEGDTVKVKVLTVSDDGKVSLSIKQAQEQKPEEQKRERKERKPYAPRPAAPAPDGSYVWTAKKSEATSFEDMMSKFKATSDEKFSDLKRKNPDAKRNRRTGGR
ncbi:MAG: S1 RNA-binding domain-containing protein [Clostridia bacterium]|nr:S1 RNA-binding domain-containing protein [Clostridia bacterium]